jgi:hypothetical protein
MQDFAATELVGGTAKAVGASGNSRPSLISTIRPSAFSRRRCMVDLDFSRRGAEPPNRNHAAPPELSAMGVKA